MMMVCRPVIVDVTNLSSRGPADVGIMKPSIPHSWVSQDTSEREKRLANNIDWINFSACCCLIDHESSKSAGPE